MFDERHRFDVRKGDLDVTFDHPVNAQRPVLCFESRVHLAHRVDHKEVGLRCEVRQTLDGLARGRSQVDDSVREVTARRCGRRRATGSAIDEREKHRPTHDRRDARPDEGPTGHLGGRHVVESSLTCVTLANRVTPSSRRLGSLCAMALHDEGHASHRVGVLRAMVLGANDGIVSIACLVLGVAASDASRNAILTAGTAGLVAGAASMALGEYVSVSSQRDSELSDIAKETWELENTPERELAELTAIYQDKGLAHDLARQVAVELTKKDALKIHLAEELGITEHNRAQPVQAAVTSAAAFGLGGVMPVIAVAIGSSTASRIWVTLAVAIAALVTLGSVGAYYGKASKRVSVRRIVIGGIIAMAFTMLVGKIFGAAVS